MNTTPPTPTASFRAPLASTPQGTPAPHEYGGLISSIQRRTIDRASLDEGSPLWRVKQASSQDAASFVEDLEADLRLSATIGAALLEEKNGLQRSLSEVEGANHKLLDRLATSVKESAQLQRRLEQAVGNLEHAESTNRALLVSLESDRKTISRLSVDAARLVSTSSQFKTLTRTHEDTLQELASEQKRAGAAESRVKKQAERVQEMEDRLKRAIEDLEEMRQDKILRKQKGNDALARFKTRFRRSSGDGLGIGVSGEGIEAAEMFKMVERLAEENDGLRMESTELRELLELSREEEQGLRSEMAHRKVYADAGDELNTPLVSGRPHNTLLSEVLMSPSGSQMLSDFDGGRPLSPTSTNPTSFARSSNFSSSRGANLERTFSTGSTSNGEHSNRYGEKAARRRSGMGLPSTGQVPFGRGHSRRAMSVDVTSLAPSNDGDSVRSPSISPLPDRNSPPTRPPSVFSDADEPAPRPRRHPRPLSLSLGPSLFAQVPEDRQSPATQSPHRYSHRPSQSISVSNSGNTSLVSAPSGLSLSSPPRRRTSVDPDRYAIITVESSTQTSPRPSTFLFRPTRRRGISADPSVSPARHSDMAHSSTCASDLSERDKVLLDFGLAPGSMDMRTAVLGTLIEHASKLLARIQSADIRTQENRLKKHNLPGDVRHVAQANLRDLLTDIEGLRTHFRRALEQERTSSAKEATSTLSESLSESLVSRRDFVSLVKLFRDLLFETSRLRSLVNRIELEPSLASSLRDLDILNVIDAEKTTTKSGGLLAPFSRLFSGSYSTEPEPVPQKPSPVSRPSVRPVAKLSGSSVVTSATVNVEFGAGVVRRAVAVEEESSMIGLGLPSQASLGGRKGNQVKRDLSSIFAGGLPQPKPSTEPWVRVPTTRIIPSNPFGRLLASYRPPLSATTNAVLDSLPHAPQPDMGYQPTLLERQLRPRGYSDSSIHTTFVAHANPHHRLVSPATLALSSEVTPAAAEARPILSHSPASDTQLKQQLTGLSTSIARKPSVGRLRDKASSSQLRSSSSLIPHSRSTREIPPVPPLPISISISPSRPTPINAAGFAPGVQASGSLRGSGSLLGNLSSWASKAAGLSPLAAAAEQEEQGEAREEAGGEHGRKMLAERSGRDFGM